MSISLVHFILNNNSSALIGYWRQTSKFHWLEIRHLRSRHCSRHQLARTNTPRVCLLLDVQKWTSINACVEHLFWREGSFGFFFVILGFGVIVNVALRRRLRRTLYDLYFKYFSLKVIGKFSWTRRGHFMTLTQRRTSKRFNKSIPFALPKNTWH